MANIGYTSKQSVWLQVNCLKPKRSLHQQNAKSTISRTLSFNNIRKFVRCAALRRHPNGEGDLMVWLGVVALLAAQQSVLYYWLVYVAELVNLNRSEIV